MTILIRVKDIDDMPQRMLCCDAMIASIVAHAGRVFEVDPATIKGRSQCIHCGADHGSTPNFRVLKDRLVPVDTVDIDEGGAA